MPNMTEHAQQVKTFETLLTPVVGPAYGMAYSMTRNATDAEDLVQEAAMRAFSGFDTFEQGTNFKAWFYRVMMNCFSKKYRRNQRAPKQVSLDDATDMYFFEGQDCGVLNGWKDDPAAAVFQKLDTESVADAISALPQDYRMVAALYFLNDLSYDQIASILECPLGTVRSRLHRARKMLQKRLWHIAVERGLTEPVYELAF